MEAIQKANMKRNIFVFILIIAILILVVRLYEEKGASRELRSCIDRIKLNGDGYTFDKEDLDLCKKTFETGTNRDDELQKAVTRPIIESNAKLL